MFESYYASRPTPESAALLDSIRDANRSEAQAAASRLVAVEKLFRARLRDSGEQADWAMDTWDAVAAQVAAVLRCSIGMGSSYLRYAVALRERLPLVGRVFQAGDIDYRAFQTIVFRTDLITDAEVLSRVDALLACRLPRCASLTRGRLAAEVDRVVAAVDRDAVRRSKEALRDRFVDIVTDERGVAFVTGTLLAPYGLSLDLRLDELAKTVCDADPRSREQRRADAMGALASGADRLVCACGSTACDAAARARKSNVMIHVIAERASIDGTGGAPGVVVGLEGLITAEMIAELGRAARVRPLVPPGSAPEPGYIPSADLADFVRARDVTCRAPGCDHPASDCDVDHTIAYRQGGHTHASNLKSLCRKHHLLKTFGRWRDVQLSDGTVIWLLPDGHTCVTMPGSALLFPNLCGPTGNLPPARPSNVSRSSNRELKMPIRSRTRRQSRAHRVEAERRLHRRLRLTGKAAAPAYDTAPPPF